MTDVNHLCSPDPNAEARKLAVAASLGILANSGGVATFPQQNRCFAVARRFVGNRTESLGLMRGELVKAIFPVPNQNDKQEIAELRELNEELTDSLRRCRTILKDCRDRLAANSNETDDPEESGGISRSG